MKNNRRASLRKTINSLDLSEADRVLKSKYKYTPGKPGRPPLPPIGMFLSFTIMFLRMESYRDYHAFLEKHSFWRRTLGFKSTPDIGNYPHFLNRIGKETFEQLFQVVVQQLLDEGFLNLHMVAQDGSILEGRSSLSLAIGDRLNDLRESIKTRFIGERVFLSFQWLRDREDLPARFHIAQKSHIIYPCETNIFETGECLSCGSGLGC